MEESVLPRVGSFVTSISSLAANQIFLLLYQSTRPVTLKNLKQGEKSSEETV